MTETSDTAAMPIAAQTRIAVWPTLRYVDAPAAIDFLTTAFGFVSVATHMSDDGTTVDHAELTWPLGGGVMLSSYAEPSNWPSKPGQGSTYVVTDDPDALYRRAVAAGATIIRELTDEDYGSRDFGAQDPEGNLWSFGTYSGESTAQ
jgi:uncharacterized glyoxalase superfamily protein PhnB